MSAAITAEATAADLLAELRELVNRYDGADSLDDVRQLADEVTQRLRRARGRISRLRPPCRQSRGARADRRARFEADRRGLHPHRRAGTVGITIVIAILTARIALVYSMYAAHQGASGGAPVAPPMPVAPAPPAPLPPS